MSPEDVTHALAAAVTNLIRDVVASPDEYRKEEALLRYFQDSEAVRRSRKNEYYSSKGKLKEGADIKKYNLALPFGAHDRRFLVYNTEYKTVSLGDSKQTSTEQTEFTELEVHILKERFKYWDLESFRLEPTTNFI